MCLGTSLLDIKGNLESVVICDDYCHLPRFGSKLSGSRQIRRIESAVLS